MRILKIIFFVILVLVLLFVILGLLGPKTYDMSRTVSIDAPRTLVWKESGTLSEMEDWGPWKQEDASMVTTFHGTDGEVGSYSHWEGESSGIGEQKITKVVENELLETELKFIAPEYMAGESDAYLKLADNAAGGTDVTWGMKGDYGFTQRAFAMIGMGMDAGVGPMYDQGLKNLTNIVMESKKEMEDGKTSVMNSDITVNRIQKEVEHFIVKRDQVDMAGIEEYYATNFPAIMMAIGAAGKEPAGMPRGLFYFWDTENAKTDMCAAIPVKDSRVKIEGYETMTLPAGEVLHVAHYGDYALTERAHIAIENYMKANGLEQIGPAQEEYANDPTAVKPEEVLTNIYYPVK